MEEMQLISVNVGSPTTISFGGKSMTTGICKYPVGIAVQVDATGLSGDAVLNTAHHGGPDQAVYAYSADDYDWWARILDREIEPGLFGENLTIRGLPTDLSIGDRLLIGDVVLEATAPRIPCGTFAARMQDSAFGLAFRDAARPGVYFRVLNEGTIAAGDSVIMIANPDDTVTVLDLFHTNYELSPDPGTLRRCLAAPVAERMRHKLEQKLAGLEDEQST